MGGYRQLPITPFEPQQSNPLQMLAGIQQLKNQRAEGASLDLENQQKQMQLDQSRALMDTAKGIDWTKDDAFDKFLSGAQSSGKINPQTLSAMSLQRAQYKEQLAKTDTATLAAEQTRNDQLLGHLDAISAEADPVKRAQVAQVQGSQIISGNLVKDPGLAQKAQAMAQGQYVPSDDDLKVFKGGLLDHKTQTQQAIDQQKANAEDWKYDRTNGLFYNVRTKESATPGAQNIAPTLAHSLIDQIAPPKGDTQDLNMRTKAQYDFYTKQGNVAAARKVLDEASQQVGRTETAVATTKAEGPTKVAIAGQEESVRQSIAGKVKPVYAYDPKSGQTILTNQTDAQERGLTATRPVTEKEVSDDRLLNNRLADVTQKIARYEATLQKPLGADDTAKMSAVIDPENKLKAGISHTELPVDSFNQIFKSSLMNHLSPAAQQRLIAYRNASEAMIGYQRVLSGSGRSSDKAMELNIASLPHPLNSPDYANEAMSQFKENLKIAGQGLPTLPGLKSPDEVLSSMSKAPSAGKTLSAAQVQQAAKDHGVSIEEAKRQAIAQGYAIQ